MNCMREVIGWVICLVLGKWPDGLWERLLSDLVYERLTYPTL
jgi:hypothetical protein